MLSKSELEAKIDELNGILESDIDERMVALFGAC
jgi:hypothetical protein